jgi:hypothetical protein
MCIKDIILFTIGLIAIITSPSCKKEIVLIEENTNHKFSISINGKYWGTDTLHSKISLNQVYINTQYTEQDYYFIFTNLYSFSSNDTFVIRLNDPELGWVSLDNYNFTFVHIDSINHRYSAIFDVTFHYSDSIINISGSIDNADYFPEYCEKTYNIIEADTFSLFGQWYLTGYKDSDSEIIHYPPCEKDPWIIFDNKEVIIDNSFWGLFVRNSFGGNYNIDTLNNISISSFGQTMVYILWNYDRNFEEEFFDSFKDIKKYHINNNVLTLYVSTTGRRYIFHKM